MPTPIRIGSQPAEPIRFVEEPETSGSSGSYTNDTESGSLSFFQKESNRFPSGAYGPLISSSSSPCWVVPSTVHVCLDNGSEFTYEDIRRWAEGQLCGIAMGEEEQVIKSLAQIIVQRVL